MTRDEEEAIVVRLLTEDGNMIVEGIMDDLVSRHGTLLGLHDAQTSFDVLAAVNRVLRYYGAPPVNLPPVTQFLEAAR